MTQQTLQTAREGGANSHALAATPPPAKGHRAMTPPEQFLQEMPYKKFR